MENGKNSFYYTYSAKQQDEIQNIRKKYLPKEQDKMEQLRKLDRNVTKKSSGIAIVLGVVGCLLLGIGMCCTLVWMGNWFVPGVVIGIIGIAAIGVAYPLYVYNNKKEREKIAPLILKLTEELSKPEK